MAGTLTEWEQPISLGIVTQSVDMGDLVETIKTVNFNAVIQPLSAERLQLKPEQVRSWQWIWIHAKTSDLNLETQDKIIYKGTRFKVMAVKKYDDYGFREYECCEDFQEN